jgi:hypothetical protein
MFFPRIVSHAADAPYLGEAALQYFLTVQPAAGVPIVAATAEWSGLVWFGLLVYFGVPLAVATQIAREARAGWRGRRAKVRRARPAVVPGTV